MSSPARRRWLSSAAALLLGGRARAAGAPPPRLVTLGDSVLDCGRYNERGLTPGQLIVHNDDALFPEFQGQDLRSHGPAALDHHATDGATVDDLPRQVQRVLQAGAGKAVVLLTVGGNDLLRGLAADSGPGLQAFERALGDVLRRLPLKPVLIGTVYDPTFGDDSRNFLSVPARVARANLARVNEVLATLAQRHGQLVDLHAHFLRGEPGWYTRTIEPSLKGASEVRRAFLPAVQRHWA
jgi:lysophospholipase L1-like esterase